MTARGDTQPCIWPVEGGENRSRAAPKRQIFRGHHKSFEDFLRERFPKCKCVIKQTDLSRAVTRSIYSRAPAVITTIGCGEKAGLAANCCSYHRTLKGIMREAFSYWAFVRFECKPATCPSRRVKIFLGVWEHFLEFTTEITMSYCLGGSGRVTLREDAEAQLEEQFRREHPSDPINKEMFPVPYNRPGRRQ